MVPYYREIREALSKIADNSNKVGDLAEFLRKANRIRHMPGTAGRALVTPQLELHYDLDQQLSAGRSKVAPYYGLGPRKVASLNLETSDGQKRLYDVLFTALRNFILGGAVESCHCSGKTHAYARIDFRDQTVGVVPLSHLAREEESSWLNLQLDPECGCATTLKLFNPGQSYLPWNLVAAATSAPLPALVEETFKVLRAENPKVGNWGWFNWMIGAVEYRASGHAIYYDPSSSKLAIGEKSFRHHLGLLKGAGIPTLIEQLQKALPQDKVKNVSCNGNIHQVVELALDNGRATRVPLDHLDDGLDAEIFYALSKDPNCFQEVQGYAPWRECVIGGVTC